MASTLRVACCFRCVPVTDIPSQYKRKAHAKTRPSEGSAGTPRITPRITPRRVPPDPLLGLASVREPHQTFWETPHKISGFVFWQTPRRGTPRRFPPNLLFRRAGAPPPRQAGQFQPNLSPSVNIKYRPMLKRGPARGPPVAHELSHDVSHEGSRRTPCWVLFQSGNPTTIFRDPHKKFCVSFFGSPRAGLSHEGSRRSPCSAEREPFQPGRPEICIPT